jgi:hypothetical protein
MSPTIRRWVTATIAIAAVLTVALVALIAIREVVPGTSDELKYWNFYLSAVKVVLVGFLVAGAGVLIPKGLSEARSAFERYNESNIAFSRAKTGVDYLSLRLCTLELKEASEYLQRVHVWKHRAELYPELQRHLQVREQTISPRQWADWMFWQLHEVRDALESRAESWDTIPRSERLGLLKAAVERGRARWERLTELPRPD